MEYITLSNGIKMPVLGMEFIRLQKMNVKDAFLTL